MMVDQVPSNVRQLKEVQLKLSFLEGTSFASYILQSTINNLVPNGVRIAPNEQ